MRFFGRTRIGLVLLSLFLLTGSPATHAWGWEAHKLVCAVAEKKLTPQARKLVNRWLENAADLEGGVLSFPDACLWPDKVKYGTRKSTYEHHFINVPDDAIRVDLNRDCAAADCIAIGIQRSLSYLSGEASGDRAATRQAAALRFLGHYIGDLHQPLHVGNASDWGGNKIRVNWLGKKTNLHALWDYEMPEKMNLRYPDSVLFLANIDVTSNGSVVAWMNESLDLARSNAYVSIDGNEIEGGDTINAEYFEKNKPIIIKRIAQAATRL
ncbi:MAG: hypothetical protein HN816_01205, partial [Gammaproteobacteria bacterium]|nr:hypothetical protein [Gammaproteobacteria bacterium]